LEACSALADSGLTIVSVKINQADRKLVYVRFQGPGPEPNSIRDTNNWQIQVKDSSGFQTYDISQATPFEPYGNTHTAKLTLTKVIPAGFQSINVTFKPVNGAQGSGTPRSTSHSSIIPADGKNDANLYLKGSVSHSGSSYTYSVDSSVSLLLHAFGKEKMDALELNGSVSADSDELGDPDSVDIRFSARSGVSHPETMTRFLGFDYRGYSKRMDIVSLETNKATDVVNLLASPRLTFPLTHILWKKNGDVPIGTLSLVPMIGIDAGWNARNELTVAKGTSHGTGAIFRGMPGARATFSWADSPALNRIVFTSEYTARLLARDELFQETRSVTTPAPSLRAGTPHYVKNSIDFMINRYAGLSLSHEYGSLPPGYKFLDQRLTFGVVFALKQDSSK
jgi:hypothetical protein